MKFKEEVVIFGKIFISFIIIISIIIFFYLKEKGEWGEYTPYKECRGYIDWRNKNEKTWQIFKFETFVSALVSFIIAWLVNHKII